MTNVIKTNIKGIVIIEPRIFENSRRIDWHIQQIKQYFARKTRSILY